MKKPKMTDEERKAKKAEYARIWRKNNPDKVKENNANYILNNRDKLIEYRKDYRKNNKGKVKAAGERYRKSRCDEIKKRKKINYELNKDKVRAKSRDYYANNSERRKAYWKAYCDARPGHQVEYLKKYREINSTKISEKRASHEMKIKRNSNRSKRRMNDPMFRESEIQRGRLLHELSKRGFSKTCRTASVIGCDWKFLCEYIEARFLPGMSWERREQFHVDHIIPLASAKTKRELHKLCHYTNLRPMWAKDNMSKGDKVLITPCLL